MGDRRRRGGSLLPTAAASGATEAGSGGVISSKKEAGSSRGSQQRQQQKQLKAKWTPSEDEKLRLLVERKGLKKWSLIAMELPGRTGKQVGLGGVRKRSSMGRTSGSGQAGGFGGKEEN